MTAISGVVDAGHAPLRGALVVFRVLAVLSIAALLLPIPAARAQQLSEEELSRAAANPLADLISLPLQNNTNGGLGQFDRVFNALNIQPVIPFAGGKVVTRTIIPVLWPPDISAESGSLDAGIGDILFTSFFVPSDSGVIWGFGPVLEVPTGGETRGSGKWGLGPSAVVLAQPGPWTLGVLVNNVWSIGGDEDREDVNKGLLQGFVVYQLGGGWYVNSAPIINVNWKAEEGQRWIVPLGMGAGRVVTLGRLPLNMQAGYYYNIVRPDVGPKWQVRLQAQFFIPTTIFRGSR